MDGSLRILLLGPLLLGACFYFLNAGSEKTPSHRAAATNVFALIPTDKSKVRVAIKAAIPPCIEKVTGIKGHPVLLKYVQDGLSEIVEMPEVQGGKSPSRTALQSFFVEIEKKQIKKIELEFSQLSQATLEKIKVSAETIKKSGPKIGECTIELAYEYLTKLEPAS